jgi:putative membrane protein
MKFSRALRLVSACPALLVALLIAKLWVTGTLGYYVNDRTTWIVLFGAFLFAGIGAAAMRNAWRTNGDEHAWSWRTMVFLVVVLLGIAVPARPLSASSAQSSSLGSLALASHVSGGGGGDLFGQWVSALAGHPDASWWAGKRVALVGFASRGSGLPGHSFILGRYLVTCCAVDATMFGFPVHLPASQSLPAQGAWIQVNGVFGRNYWTDPSGEQYPIIQHASVGPARVPSSPYLSP